MQQDANFNVTALLNNAGAVVERYVYDPFGATTVLNAAWSAIADVTPADVAAGRISLGQLAYTLYGARKCVSKIEYYVIVDLDGQNVLNPVPHNFMIPDTAPLDVTGKIVASGNTVP